MAEFNDDSLRALTECESGSALESRTAFGVREMEPAEVDVGEFLRELRHSRREVEIARQQFDVVVDPMLIDHIVFRLGAAEKRLNYLFQLARQLNISVDEQFWEWESDHVAG